MYYIQQFVLSILGAMCFLTASAHGGHCVIHVPGDFPTIQSAISDAATANGCEIVVAPGCYYEAINFLGKAITVRGSGGPDVTRIDITGFNDIAVRCVNGEGPSTVLRGFTITGGGGKGFPGGGMYNHGSSPTIIDCIFHRNIGSDAAGMLNVDSDPCVCNCTFSENSIIYGGSRHGAGMENGGDSSPMLISCTFLGNAASGGVSNIGGGIANTGNGANPTIRNCSFVENIATEGAAIWSSPSSCPTITCSHFCENDLFGCWNNGGGNQFGICPSSCCPSNLDGSGDGVGVADLVALILNWGPCP